MSLEKSAEDIEILLLAGNATIAAMITAGTIAVTNFNNDSHANKNRIVVNALPRVPELMDATNTVVAVWRIPVEVTVHYASGDASGMDTVIAAVEAANTGTAAPSAVTAATSAFPRGCKIEETEDNSREQDENTRDRKRVFNFIVPA